MTLTDAGPLIAVIDADEPDHALCGGALDRVTIPLSRRGRHSPKRCTCSLVPAALVPNKRSDAWCEPTASSLPISLRPRSIGALA